MNKLCCEVHPVVRCHKCDWKLCEDCGIASYNKASKRFPRYNRLADLHYDYKQCEEKYLAWAAKCPTTW